MSKFPKAVAAALVAGALFAVPAAAAEGPFGLGRAAHPDEIAAWDIDIRPDGQGLPEGSGSVELGDQVFADQCAMCHGDFGEGLDRWPVLAGGRGSLTADRPVKTVGSYWPYLSTLYDYIHRAMPFGNARSLTTDETYGVVAYILYLNDIVLDDFVLSRSNFTEVKMPNQDNFIEDDRPDTPGLAAGEPCMSNCKDDAQVTARAVVLDVTPEIE